MTLTELSGIYEKKKPKPEPSIYHVSVQEKKEKVWSVIFPIKELVSYYVWRTSDGILVMQLKK